MLDCNTLVFASLSQTTLLRSYTIDTMNDNTYPASVYERARATYGA